MQPQPLTSPEHRQPSTDNRSPHDLFFEWRSLARRGDLAAAWDVSDRALELARNGVTDAFPRHFRGVWTGTPVENKRVLVRCYHGLGDTIQFARLIPRLCEAASEVTVLAQPQLVRLLSNVCEGTQLHGADVEHQAKHDVEIEIMELGHVFRITLDDIPRDVPYLQTEAVPIEDNGALKVGLVWQAGDWDDRRSVPFASLLEWTSVPGMEFYSLQQDPWRAGWRPPSVKLLDASTVDKTASLMRGLDLVITVDTMTAHLAGALGVPVWTLLQRDADWRWMEDRSDSPWYPTMRLFRQRDQDDWTSVIRSVADTLERSASSRL